MLLDSHALKFQHFGMTFGLLDGEKCPLKINSVHDAYVRDNHGESWAL